MVFNFFYILSGLIMGSCIYLFILEPDFMRFRLPLNISSNMALAKQIPSITTDPAGATVDYLVSRNPCSCEFGICKCCTGES